MSNALVDFYRCPEELVAIAPAELKSRSGYFQFGPGTLCYGQSTLDEPSRRATSSAPDLLPNVSLRDSVLQVPFDPSGIVDNLRLERYPVPGRSGIRGWLSSEAVRRIYYSLRPKMSLSLRKPLQRFYLRKWNSLAFPKWPVDTTVEDLLQRLLLTSMKLRGINSIPFIWFWPNAAAAAAIMTHDVETQAGLDFVRNLMDVDDTFGIKSSFQLVPEERYSVPRDLIRDIKQRQFEVNVHSLNHRGNLFGDRRTFLKQAALINHYVEEFGAEGFRSACMYRNIEWFREFQVSYDMSVPNVAHLEPQRGGCCSVFPYFIGNILELPLTTAQDYSLFHIIGDHSIELWRKQAEMILERHGLISFLTHPDYLQTDQALRIYKELLSYVKTLSGKMGIWVARPGEVNHWWRERSVMSLVQEGDRWRVQGHGSDRARVGFASLQNGRVVYTMDEDCFVKAVPAVATRRRYRAAATPC